MRLESNSANEPLAPFEGLTALRGRGSHRASNAERQFVRAARYVG
jgi:hypothetical protein